ncbi:6657_t:CDS:1, partial [Paraglomus occultum]
SSGFSSNLVGHFDHLNTDDNSSMEEGEKLFSNVRKYLEDAQTDQHSKKKIAGGLGYFSGIRKLVEL